MRVLFCSTGGAGHVQPLRPLAQALRRRGQRVAWFTAADALVPLQDQGLELFAGGLSADAGRCAFRAAHPEAAGLRGEALSAYTFPRLFAGILAPAMLHDLGAVIDRWRPDLVVHEPAALAAPLACRVRGLPNITQAYGLRLPPAYLADAMALFGARWRDAGLAVPPDGGLGGHRYLEVAPASLQAPAGGPGEHVDRFDPYRPAASGPPPLPATLREALARSAGPCLYLTFGTVFHRSPALSVAAAALAGLGGLVVVTAAGDGIAGGPGPLPPQVQVHRFVDQAALLPFCDAVVSHGGAGTVLGAAAHGLPQLLLPQAADHFRNARALAATGAGSFVTPEALSVDVVRACAHDLLASAAPRAAAVRLAREFGDLPGADAMAARLA